MVEGEAGPSSSATEKKTVSPQEAWEAVLTMLIELPSADDAKKDGLLVSMIFSMHQGLGQLLCVKGGLGTGQKVKAKMGDGTDHFFNAVMSNDVKRSKKWKINMQSDGSVKCAGSMEALKKVYEALVNGSYVTDAYDTWNGTISGDIFKQLLAVAPWKKQERKSNGSSKDPVKPDADEETPGAGGKQPSKPVAAQKPNTTVPTGGADSPDTDVITVDSKQAAQAAGEAALAVLRNQTRGNSELLTAVAQLQGSLDYLCEHFGEGGSSSEEAPDAGMASSVQGDTLTYEFPAFPNTKVGVKATPKRTRFQLQVPRGSVAHVQTHSSLLTVLFPSRQIENSYPLSPPKTGIGLVALGTNKILGLQPGAHITPFIAVPDQRMLLDVEPSEQELDERAKAGKKKRKAAPQGESWYNEGARLMQYGMPLVPKLVDLESDDESDGGFN